VVVAEGVTSAENLAQTLKEKLKKDVKSLDIGYIQRGGNPTTNDRILATRMGTLAIEEVTRGKFGVAIGGNYVKVASFKLDDIFGIKDSFDEKLLKKNDLLSI